MSVTQRNVNQTDSWATYIEEADDFVTVWAKGAFQ
eukprot:COSAG02_NODE_33844_length_493_cov_1.144670_2_plen_34_part_01